MTISVNGLVFLESYNSDVVSKKIFGVNLDVSKFLPTGRMPNNIVFGFLLELVPR